MAKRAKLPKPPYPLPSKLQYKLKKKRSIPSAQSNPESSQSHKRRRLSTSQDVHTMINPALEEELCNGFSTITDTSPLLLATPTPPPRGPPAATRIPAETFELIFYHLKDIIMTLPLPDLPIRAKTPTTYNEGIDNQRLTNEEVMTYKRFLVKKQLNDLGKVCRNWRDRVKDVRNGNEVIIIGENDGHRAFTRPSAWFPLDLTRPLDLTVQVTLQTFIKIINSLTQLYPTVRIDKLTILHSFRPEGKPDELCNPPQEEGDPSSVSEDKIDRLLSKIKPRSVHVEWYAGEDILTKNCINSIAKTLKRNHMDPEVLEERLNGMKVKTGNYNLPRDWDIKNDLSKVMTNRMLIVWRQCMIDFALRANHMMILQELRESANFGVIDNFDYHFVSVPLRTIKKSHPLPVPYDSPIPPMGSLRSIDNILLWDLRWRDPKWMRRRNKAVAAERGETYNWRDNVPSPPIEWTVWGSFDMWKQQKDRRQFKGEGKDIPWKGKTREIDETLAQFFMERSKKWIKPYDWIYKSEKENFEDMIRFVVERNHKVKKPPKSFNNNAFLLALRKEGKILNEDVIKARILEVRMKGKEEKLRNIDEEMFMMNRPESNQLQYNELYIREWLKLQTEQEKKLLVEKLRRKYKSKGLYTRMNWPLYHPNQPGVRFCVEPRII
ncbi:uncharacterized protein L199_001708 [Kwoniella botswanensis]|uniref:uncharacterized protein n=1 Tax=Kwoniella botswanensis TaxID=1268659 RepID=UPI00315D449A